MLQTQYARQKQINHRGYFLKVLSTIRFLARQALLLRGDGEEKDLYFYQLLSVCGENLPNITAMMAKKQLKYIPHDIQNEMRCIMTQQALQRIISQLQSSFF